MQEQQVDTDRLTTFSDGVIAVIITVMVLELKAPESPSIAALLPLWPTAIAYAVSYLFIAIIWINHHHLMRFVPSATPRLIWINFAHLFLVALVPFATSWIARTRLAAVPVAAYAAMFVCVNIAYVVFERDVFRHADPGRISKHARRIARIRSLCTLTIFTSAMLIALVRPFAGFALICGALILYLRPDLPGHHAGH